MGESSWNVWKVLLNFPNPSRRSFRSSGTTARATARGALPCLAVNRSQRCQISRPSMSMCTSAHGLVSLCTSAHGSRVTVCSEYTDSKTLEEDYAAEKVHPGDLKYCTGL